MRVMKLDDVTFNQAAFLRNFLVFFTLAIVFLLTLIAK